MAPDGRPPAKKVKTTLETDSSIGLLYDRPKQHAVAELFKPTMIEIHVYDREINLQGKEKEVFVVPRALICHRSEYFEKMFGSRFVEAHSRVVELDDVLPWVFRCFVGWLYTHRVFHDPNRVEREVTDAIEGEQSNSIPEAPESTMVDVEAVKGSESEDEIEYENLSVVANRPRFTDEFAKAASVSKEANARTNATQNKAGSTSVPKAAVKWDESEEDEDDP